MSGFLVLRWLSLLVDAAVKSAALLVAAGAVSLLLRRASAASRHLLWRLTLSSLLCLPPLALLLPGWYVLPWPQLVPPPRAEQFRINTETRRHGGPTVLVERTGWILAPTNRRPVPSPLHPSVSPCLRVNSDYSHTVALPPGWILLIWMAGVGAVLGPVGAAAARVRGWARRGRQVTDGALAALFVDLRREIPLRQPVSLLQGEPDDRQVIPMTWGWARPVVLLPAEADGWPADRLRAVLLHELAHVQRGDWLAQIAACGACALYWFQPLVWLAARQLRIESERACDDRVLTAGIPAPDYATHLLEVARLLRAGERAPRMALAMAARSPIEQRLRSILEARHSRRAVPPWASQLAVLLAASAVVPLAAVRPVEETASGRGTPPAGPRPSAGRMASARATQERSPAGRVTAVEISERPALLETRLMRPPTLVAITERPVPELSPRDAEASDRSPEPARSRSGSPASEAVRRLPASGSRLRGRALGAESPEPPYGRQTASVSERRPTAGAGAAAGDPAPDRPAAPSGALLVAAPEQPEAPRVVAAVSAAGGPEALAVSQNDDGAAIPAPDDARETPSPSAVVRLVAAEDPATEPVPAATVDQPAAPGTTPPELDLTGPPAAPHLLLATTGEPEVVPAAPARDGSGAGGAAPLAGGEASLPGPTPASLDAGVEGQIGVLWIWDSQQQRWTGALLIWSGAAADPAARPAAPDGAAPPPAGDPPAPANGAPELRFWDPVLQEWRQGREGQGQV